MIDIEELKRKVGIGLTSKEEAKRLFELEFGIDKESRTSAQWRKLVKTYGASVVMEKEKIDANELIKRCREKFSDRLKRQFNANRLRH